MSNSNSIDICVICLEKLQTELTLISECGHIYHSQCLQAHLTVRTQNGQQQDCPQCRRKVIPQTCVTANNFCDLIQKMTRWHETVRTCVYLLFFVLCVCVGLRFNILDTLLLFSVFIAFKILPECHWFQILWTKYNHLSIKGFIVLEHDNFD